MKNVFPWLLVLILASSLFFVSGQKQRKDARIAELEKQGSELETLRAEVQELHQAQANAKEATRNDDENVEILKLRNEVTRLKKESAAHSARTVNGEETESQLTPDKIRQLVKENEQLRNEADEARIVKERNDCINNLHQLDGATDQWAIENRKATGATASAKDVEPYLQKFPQCPSGGTYTVGPVGTAPTCSVPGHALPVDLP